MTLSLKLSSAIPVYFGDLPTDLQQKPGMSFSTVLLQISCWIWSEKKIKQVVKTIQLTYIINKNKNECTCMILVYQP